MLRSLLSAFRYRSLLPRWAGVLASCCLFLVGLAAAQDSKQDAKQDAGPPPPAQAAKPSDAAAIAAYRQANRVAVVTIDGVIDGVTAMSVERRLAAAARGGADAIVIEIDTPGGEVDAVLRICNAIKQSQIQNTVAWINPDAYSGGAIIAMACREMVINDPASFGDAKPISATISGRISKDMLTKLIPPLVAEVVDSVRRHNQYFGRYIRDEYLAQAIIADDVELWEVRHKETGVLLCIDREEFRFLFPDEPTGGPTRLQGVPGRPEEPSQTSSDPGNQTISPSGSAKLLPYAEQVKSQAALTTAPPPSTARPRIGAADLGRWELLGKVKDARGAAVLKTADLLHFGWIANQTRLVDGRPTVIPVATDDDLRAFFGASDLRRINENWSEALVRVLTGLPARFILIVVFLIALFVEMTHPGAVVPGLIAVLALGALLAPPMLVGLASWWEIAAILIGIALLVVEILVLPGFGVPGVLGIILLLVGLIGTFIPKGGGLFPDTQEAQSDMLSGAVTVMLAGATAIVGMWLLARHLGSIPILNRLVLKNATGDDVDVAVLGPPEIEPAAAVGDVGIAITPLRPAGRVQIGDEVVDAVAEFGFIDSGTKVRVVSADGLRIGVEPVAGV